MITLRKAIKEGKLGQFIREHEKDEPGDMEKLDEAIKRPASRTSKEAPKASPRDEGDD
jgi:hypothetical protein